MSEEISATADFEPATASVSEARRLFQEIVEQGGTDPEITIDGPLLVSELVTNAFVHAGTAARMNIRAGTAGVRVEVLDGRACRPARRFFANSASTGRGLRLLEELSSRWGVDPTEGGKAVWFELGEVKRESSDVVTSPLSRRSPVELDGPTAQVTLRNVPLLMHLAWQEHAASLLRELLLKKVKAEHESMGEHARASQALSILAERLPAPDLDADRDPDLLMADAIEPRVTAEEVVLWIPADAVGNFKVLDRLLDEAIRESQAGSLLCPPTQPEMSELGEWFCAEVARQGTGTKTARPWVARTDVRATLADQDLLTATYAKLAQVDEPLLATNGASIIVAASESALAALGYTSAEQILGRRVIVVVPSRFHQAHIAGTTLHETNGRDNLLNVPIAVPMVRADGTEIDVHIEVRKEPLDAINRVFVARFRLAESAE